MEIAPGIRRIGPGLVNAYLLEEAGEVTIVDAGVAGYWNDLPAELAATGRTLDDVRAVVLTHGHSDHIGFAERIRAERGVPVSIHELDAALARGEVPNPAKGVGPFRITAAARFLAWSARHGGLRTTPLVEGRPSATARRSTCPARRGSSTCRVIRRAVRPSTFASAAPCWWATPWRRGT